MKSVPPPQKPLLVIGHPGHELRIWGWLCATRPSVCVLTDGSGSTGQIRADATREALRQTGAIPGTIFGAMTDTAIYDALLDRDHDVFLDLAETLACSIVAEKKTMIVSDAIEGYNPTHDVCRLIVDAARTVADRRGQSAQAFEFSVVGDPRPDKGAFGAVSHHLDDEALEWKIQVARDYAREAGAELEREVKELLARHGPEAFRHEWLVPVHDVPLETRFADAPPFFEQHGERRVLEGKYGRVLRLKDHIVPLEHALTEWTRSLAS